MLNPTDLQLLNVLREDRMRRLNPSLDRDSRSRDRRPGRRRPKNEHGAR